MLVSVVEKGHGKRAGVPGYWVAGKTGTAQVVNPQTKQYYKDVTVGSFAGFAPVPDPTFVMLVRIDHPRDVQWAESSAAPVFGEMAAYLLNVDHVPPVRPIKPPPPTVVSTSTYEATTTNP
jgi:cell division protein FtsI/penicillin-binding protein 2